MNNIKIQIPNNPSWVFPMILDGKNVCVHLNPHKGTKQLANVWLYCITLKCRDTPAILRLSNLRKAKRLCKLIDKHLVDNNLSYDDILQDIRSGKNSFRSYITGLVLEHNVQCFIRSGTTN